MPLPTPVRFEPIEALPVTLASTLPSSLQVSSTPLYYKAMVLRLLAGTTKIRCGKSGLEIEQLNNYSTLRFTPNTRITKAILSRAVRPKTLAGYDRFVKAIPLNNQKFYADIYFEFCGYFFAQHKQNHTVAFVHLYRILERVSYALPLFWAARAKEYETTFVALRAYLTDPKIGELGFFKKFVPGFINATYLSVPVDLKVVSSFPDWQERHFETLQEVLTALKAEILSATPYSQITIKYAAMINLIVKIRNKYFHALTGASDSFGSEDIMDFDEFCGPLNEDMANWIAFILFQIFEFELQ